MFFFLKDKYDYLIKNCFDCVTDHEQNKFKKQKGNIHTERNLSGSTVYHRAQRITDDWPNPMFAFYIPVKNQTTIYLWVKKLQL